jgi:membrane associated rhomboid family serine protease
MTNYLLASGAIWIAVSIISSLGHITVLGKTYQNMNGWFEAQTGKRRLPLYYIGSLAFALIFAYLIRLAWPADVPVASGAIFGLLAGLALYIPQMLNQFAAFPYPPTLVIGGAIIGILQTTIAGLVGGLLL